MRKIAIVSGLLLAAAFIPGCAGHGRMSAVDAPGSMPLRSASKDVVTCNTKVGGVCVMPCDYTASKKAKHHKRKKK